MKKHKLLYVQWIDSCSYGGVRSSVESLKRSSPAICHSIGWLIKEDKDCIVIAASIDGEFDGDAGGDMTIPKVCIKRRRVIPSPV